MGVWFWVLLYAVALSLALLRRAPTSARGVRTSFTGRTDVRILVVGATGGTGREVVQQALRRGHLVTALVRTPAKLGLDHPRLQVLRGDVMDYGSVEAALRGQEAVVCTLGHKRWFYPTCILSDGTRNILRAMEVHAVPRLVCETSLGIGSSSGRLGLPYTLFVIPFILPFYFWDKVRQERAIATSKVDWVIVRPGVLVTGPGRGTCRHGAKIGSFLWPVRISRADVAAFMLDQVTGDKYVGAAPGVCS